jgi:hypothetical protein
MRPLEGITVVALEHAIAPPVATRQLAALMYRRPVVSPADRQGRQIEIVLLGSPVE